MRLAFLILFSLIISAAAPSVLLAQDVKKTFYDKNINEDLSLWRLQQKKLTTDQKKELDKYIEKLSEARLKEEKAREDVTKAGEKLNDFLGGKDKKVNGEKSRIQDNINRAKRKVQHAQKNLDQEKKKLEDLQKRFDDDFGKAKTSIEDQEQRLHETVRRSEDRLENAKKNKESVLKQIEDFEKAVQ